MGATYDFDRPHGIADQRQPIPHGPYVDPHQRGAEAEGTGAAAAMVRTGVMHVREGETPRDAMRRYVLAGGRPEDIPGWHDRRIADAAETGMIAPPPDPAVDRDWRWSEWLRERAVFSLPGWTYCRFPIQFPGDRAVFVFGMVRESFGVYHTPFKVRHAESAHSVETVLACMVHMRTGCGMGLFESRQVAAQACELAEKVDTRWSDVDPQDPATWGQIISRVGATWYGAGIVPMPDVYAHNNDGHTWHVYGTTPETVMHGRPEKLS